MARNQLDNARLEVYRDIADDVEESDFVPYACLYDPDTILTKNGELLQIIKITGFTYESVEHSDADIRSVIRKAVEQSIHSNEYALWFTTIRRKKKLSPDGDYPDAFSSELHEAWKHRNQWDRKYINELYITVVREGQSADITSPKGFFSGLLASRDRKIRNAYLDRIADELKDTMARMLTALGAFGAHRLTVVQRDGIYYGEHLEFLEKLINLEERPMPLDEIGLSDYLTSGEITFAYNAMEVRSAEGDRRFGAVMTVKEYKEASLYRIDEFLQIPCEFIITQCLDFINAKQALQSYKEQQHYLEISGDEELLQKSELKRILSSSDDKVTDYGQQQTTIFVIGESVAELEHSIQQIRNSLNNIGIIVIREDLRFEDMYWATLPANFEFISRLNYVDTQHIGGFVNIQNYPAGNAKGCPWGPPVTLFYTAAGTPYFFNFHLQEKGHTMILGPKGSGKSVLLNFLLSESRKYRNRLFYLDARGHAQAFVQAIGGNYFTVTDAAATHHVSPLSLPDNPINREFLAAWLITLTDSSAQAMTAERMAIFSSIVEQMYQHDPSQRTFAFIAQHLQQRDPQSAEKLARWHSGGELAHLFDHPSETVAPSQSILGFNLSQALDQPDLLMPLASYLIHRMTMTLSGAPSVIVLDEGWRLCHNPLFASRIKPWLEYITSKNALVIFTTEEMLEATTYPFCKDITDMAETQIYLPDEDPELVYQDAFGLTDDEFAYLDAMSEEYRHFMLKRRSETIIGELNLGGMDNILEVLSGTALTAPSSQSPMQQPQPEQQGG